jgi:hypothetical protein
VAVGEDVRGLEEFGVAEAADRALVVVGARYPLAEGLLVQALRDSRGSTFHCPQIP